MTGLNLIQEYLSDTDEEIENSNNENKKLFKDKNINIKLPLPESILSWKGVTYNEEVIDDPLKHDGRIRSFKHERGNWATLVYIDYLPSDNILFWMKNVIIHFVGTSNLFEEFHMSLTRTLILKFHWIDSFVEAVKNIATNYQNFSIELQSIKIYCNEDATRTFVGITVQSTNNILQNIIRTLDKLMTDYQLPIYYKDASYHISFLWCLGDQRKKLEALLPSLIANFNDFFVDHPDQRYVQIDKLKCKIGNKLYNFNLQ
ncbi:PREDICTED: U6 snRNA phosphodiesterase [Ceratosolen solmsi marchali]|uniref:U6 snRNA phosphodiesterase n=1 Tax=Ceratosolen solmsi marchali TaxID=326594 RepID=A0AAJ7DZK3_9HYME|nr:PREDICTED: U6 snRNA phosphodiesterase [Ceratosolen solmsi marchali]